MTTRRLPARSCKNCGAPSDQRALCTLCSLRKLTTAHWDKYADKSKGQ
jgi:hypothetical protein